MASRATKSTGKPGKAPAKKKAVANAPAVRRKAEESARRRKDVSRQSRPDLSAVREQIDGIDREIQALIAERALWAHQVGKAKGKLAAAIDYYRPEREAQVLRKVVDRNDGPLQDEVLVRLFREI
ncbi:MAG: chorismate mutase, partial [Luteimonas sp.]|nr:chorismate mutase [Luteimonas sp.]